MAERAYDSIARENPEGAADELVTLVYDELRIIATHLLGRGIGPHTLQPTALVHEVYLKLAEQTRDKWNGQAHFMAVAAIAMRQILIDYARKARAQKRGGGVRRVTLSEAVDPSAADVDLVALDDALTKLAELDARQARVVELRFLAGLSIEDAASVLGVSPGTVKADWRMARAWLMRELTEDQ